MRIPIASHVLTETLIVSLIAVGISLVVLARQRHQVELAAITGVAFGLAATKRPQALAVLLGTHTPVTTDGHPLTTMPPYARRRGWNYPDFFVANSGSPKRGGRFFMSLRTSRTLPADA